MDKPATVKEIIERLQQLPQDLPCYIRPKYYGRVEKYEDVPIHLNGISEMEANKNSGKCFVNEEHVTFLL